MMRHKVLLVSVLLGFFPGAWGQTACPMGVQAGDARCGPSPDTTTAITSSAIPEPIWSDRWGAIAFDDTIGGVGTAIGMRSKRKAEKEALIACRKKGGSGCRIDLTYHNQCGVIAWGDSAATTASAATKEQASERALQTCSEHTEGCKIYYEDCSYPVRTN